MVANHGIMPAIWQSYRALGKAHTNALADEPKIAMPMIFHRAHVCALRFF